MYLKKLLYTHSLPDLSYCNVWGNANPSYINHLFLQKEAVHIVTNSHFLAHHNLPQQHTLQEIKFTKYFDIHSHDCGIFTSKFMNKLLLDNFNKLFTYNCNVHLHYTTVGPQNIYSQLLFIEKLSNAPASLTMLASGTIFS